MVRVVFHSCNASSYVLLPIYLQECKEIKTYIESKSQHPKGRLGAVCPCVYMYNFLASQGALEVMYVSQSLSQSADRDSTDVTLVSEDTNRRLYLCDSGE